MTSPLVSLVVPVHDCSGCLARTLSDCLDFIAAADGRCELVIVDDHGTDPRAGRHLDQAARHEHVTVIRNDRNRGKGYSVKRGMLAASGLFRVFTDADLAYPLSEVWTIVAALEKGADVAIACRVLPKSRYEMNADYLRYLYTRHVMSRAFNGLVRLTLLPGLLDTQAGLKGFTAAAASAVFPRISIPGFGFDLECLYVARRLGLQVSQVPVAFRYESEPSTVSFLRDGLTMTGDLARIRWRSWSGEYETSRH